jgi:hypothetical protein
MKLIKLLILFLFLSLKGFSQQAVLTSSGEKVILNFLSLSGGTISGTLTVSGTTTISGTTTLTGINNTGTITNTGALINTGNLTVNGNGTITGTLGVTGATTITGTLTLPSLYASTFLYSNGSKNVVGRNLDGDISTIGTTATLTNTGVISGTYGSSTAVPQITVDSKGRITTITTTAITSGGTSTITHTIGESYGGGKVFYVTTDGLHGYIAETQDQSSSCTWYNAQDVISNPDNHSDNGKKFTDWRLPTKYELNLMRNARSTIGGIANVSYWSSTEHDYSLAYIQDFGGGGADYFSKTLTVYVRAVRAF